MFTKGFWKWVLVGGLVSSTFLGAKAQSIKELEKDCQSGNPNACAKLRGDYNGAIYPIYSHFTFDVRLWAKVHS